MPRKTDPLSDVEIKALIRARKPGDAPKKHSDGGGLYLEMMPTGGNLWRMKYRFGGKEKRLSFGAYPAVGLKDARLKREEARKLIAHGVDPGEHKKAVKAAKAERDANSFEVVAREWFSQFEKSRSKGHTSKIISRLNRDVFPWLGAKPVAAITAPEILSVLLRIVDRGAVETAHRAKGDISQIIRYAIATGRAERDPCPDLRGALPTSIPKHFAAVTDPRKVGELLRVFDGYEGTLIVRCALKLAPLLFVRPGELRHMRWSEIDLNTAEWKFTTSKTKTAHLVPLSRQAVRILLDLQPLRANSDFVFAGRDPKRPMSENSVNAALKRLGIDTAEELTGHGFRAMARTILAEQLHIPGEIIEHQLAHKVADSLGNAYNRTKFLKERKVMMQTWSDFLDKLRDGAAVIPLRDSA